MASPPPHLLAYAEAQAKLARIEERLRLSPVRQPWATRMALAERQALAAIDAVDLPDEAVIIEARGRVGTSGYDLTHWKQAIGQPVTLAALQADPPALLAWLGAEGRDGDTRPGQRPSWERESAIEAWQRACRAMSPAPPLLHAGRIAALWRQLAPLARSDTIASLLIGDRWGPGRWQGTQGGLTALGLRRTGGAWKIASGDALDRLWLDAIAAGADAHLDLEVRLRGYAQRAALHLHARRRLGRLKDVLAFAMARPFITSSQVAKKFGLTSAGAIKLLTTAETEGLLVERTGQASFRSYSIPVSSAAASPSRRRAPAADLFESTIWDEEGENDLRSEPL